MVCFIIGWTVGGRVNGVMNLPRVRGLKIKVCREPAAKVRNSCSRLLIVVPATCGWWLWPIWSMDQWITTSTIFDLVGVCDEPTTVCAADGTDLVRGKLNIPSLSIWPCLIVSWIVVSLIVCVWCAERLSPGQAQIYPTNTWYKIILLNEWTCTLVDCWIPCFISRLSMADWQYLLFLLVSFFTVQVCARKYSYNEKVSRHHVEKLKKSCHLSQALMWIVFPSYFRLSSMWTKSGRTTTLMRRTSTTRCPCAVRIR
jgi:hypothetical protein